MSEKLDGQIMAIQARLSTIEAYRKLAEWVNSVVPSEKNLKKLIPNSDTLVEVAQDLSRYALSKAESLANGIDLSISVFTPDEIIVLKEFVTTIKSKMPTK